MIGRKSLPEFDMGTPLLKHVYTGAGKARMMALPKPTTENLPDLIGKVTSGRIKIPQFQRDFVWSLNKSANLLDSIMKGYPVGTFIIWKTKERLRSVKNIGGMNLPDPPDGDYVHFVLDGQQRITSLIAALRGETIQRGDGRKEDFGNIVVDLEAEDGESIVGAGRGQVEKRSAITSRGAMPRGMALAGNSQVEKRSVISLKTLYDGGTAALAKFDAKYYGKLDEYSGTLKAYNFSIIEVNDAPIHIATEIFTRMNVGGIPLSVFEIMVAKTYDPKTGFDMAERFRNLIENLDDVGYGTLPDMSVLQTISLVLKGECKRKIILSLERERVIDIWDKVIDAIRSAVDYFRDYYRIPVSNLLPYKTLIVPFAYFFFKHDGRPYGKKQKYLDDFFWRVSLSGRYSSGVETKLTQDAKRIDKILCGELPTYDWPIDLSPDFIIRNGHFRTGRSYIKAILCIYAHMQPKSFDNNSLVRIDNAWLKQSNSKNYHHFFPKAYLKEKGTDGEKIDHILNITIVDEFLNKGKIKRRAPSAYMTEFKEMNPKIADTMKSHLIGNLDSFGVWSDDYSTFFEARARLLSQEIHDKVIEQEEDLRMQPDLIGDNSELDGVE